MARPVLEGAGVQASNESVVARGRSGLVPAARLAIAVVVLIAVAGVVLWNHHPPRQPAQTGELQVAYRVSAGVRAAGFRDIEIDYRFRGASHTLLPNTAYTACPIGTRTVSQVSDYCESHQLHASAHFTNR